MAAAPAKASSMVVLRTAMEAASEVVRTASTATNNASVSVVKVVKALLTVVVNPAVETTLAYCICEFPTPIQHVTDYIPHCQDRTRG
jgi:hypothetical protein